MTATSDGLVVSEDDGVLRMHLAREERLNSFDGDDLGCLADAFELAAARETVRCVLISADGRAFSVGADRSIIDPATPREHRIAASQEFERLLDGLQSCPVPVVAGVNGMAVGFGCTMLLHCDLVVAAASARFRLPFTTLGIPPEAGSSFLLPDRVGHADAMWMLLTGGWVDAARALEVGLVWRVVEDSSLASVAAETAAVVASSERAALIACKQLVLEARGDAVREARVRELRAMDDAFRR